jgi:hypothetical protein
VCRFVANLSEQEVACRMRAPIRRFKTAGLPVTKEAERYGSYDLSAAEAKQARGSGSLKSPKHRQRIGENATDDHRNHKPAPGGGTENA